MILLTAEIIKKCPPCRLVNSVRGELIMRKFICLLLLCLCSLSLAAAEGIDLTGLSFDDLAALRDRCQLEMMQREEWQEVDVPPGVYTVGKEIPAGTWTIYSRYGYGTNISFGEKLNAAGQEIEYSLFGRQAHELVYNPKNSNYQEGRITQWTVNFITGDYVVISTNTATFIPGASAPSFKFK